VEFRRRDLRVKGGRRSTKQEDPQHTHPERLRRLLALFVFI
jgi:hypothetical protein